MGFEPTTLSSPVRSANGTVASILLINFVDLWMDVLFRLLPKTKMSNVVQSCPLLVVAVTKRLQTDALMCQMRKVPKSELKGCSSNLLTPPSPHKNLRVVDLASSLFDKTKGEVPRSMGVHT